MIVFPFLALTALQTDEVSWPFDGDFVLWAITGNYVNASDNLGFKVQLTHTHQGKTRPMFNKHQLHSNVLGSGQRPFLMRETYLFQQGDSLLVEVKNLSQAATTSRCEVVLCGTQLE
ncbi:MAG: hypothetical protein JWO13_833 [Acidobacteriales bacterium]|nr:hypothetical protein [Terriglobales bacterium]